METYPKKFGSTKNIPESEVKYAHKLHSSSQYAEEKPFSEPYEPQEEFDYMSLMQFKSKYPFSMNPNVVFPRGGSDSKEEGQFDAAKEGGSFRYEWPLQSLNLP
jgi:hypothetical protein